MLGFGEGEGEFEAAGGVVADGDVAAVELGGTLDDGKAYASASFLTRPSGFYAIETIEKMLEMLLRDAGAIVADDDAIVLLIFFLQEDGDGGSS